MTAVTICSKTMKIKIKNKCSSRAHHLLYAHHTLFLVYFSYTLLLLLLRGGGSSGGIRACSADVACALSQQEDRAVVSEHDP